MASSILNHSLFLPVDKNKTPLWRELGHDGADQRNREKNILRIGFHPLLAGLIIYYKKNTGDTSERPGKKDSISPIFCILIFEVIINVDLYQC